MLSSSYSLFDFCLSFIRNLRCLIFHSRGSGIASIIVQLLIRILMQQIRRKKISQSIPTQNINDIMPHSSFSLYIISLILSTNRSLEQSFPKYIMIGSYLFMFIVTEKAVLVWIPRQLNCTFML